MTWYQIALLTVGTILLFAVTVAAVFISLARTGAITGRRCVICGGKGTNCIVEHWYCDNCWEERFGK